MTTLPCPACAKRAGLVKEVVWHCRWCDHWFVAPRRPISAEYDVVEVWMRKYVATIKELRDFGVIRHFDEWYTKLNGCLEWHHSSTQQLIALAQFGVELKEFKDKQLCATNASGS